MGLETSKRGLYTQQSALYTTGHNISNANTIGYSRQRVNMQATLGYPGAGLNAPMTQGHIGTGVEAGSVQRIRDQFIDRQYRQESNKLGYWSSKSDAISQMEDVMAEPSEYGMNKAFDDFYEALQVLSTNPENAAAREVVLQKGAHLADSFNYINSQLAEIQGNLKNEIRTETDAVNSILRQIAEINEQIQKIEPNGYLPNDLYDARDNLIDQLSGYLPIEIDYTKSGGNALAMAEGSVVIKFKGVKDQNGDDLELVNGKQVRQLQAQSGGAGLAKDEKFQSFTNFGLSAMVPVENAKALFDPQNPTNSANFGAESVGHNQLIIGGGKLSALIQSYGYDDAGTTLQKDAKGEYPEMLAELDKLAKAFIDEFNAVHQAGFQLNSNTPGGKFFDGADASSIKVVITNASEIAASTAQGEEGDGKNAIALSKIKEKALAGLGGATTQTFYESMVAKVGVNGAEANRLAYNTTTILLTVSNNRASVSSVSLDEEMTNMITFQQAYNASARMVTVIDETLDKIINGMGRVGI